MGRRRRSRECVTDQPAGEADHGDGRLRRLAHVQQVVEQRLVLVLGKQVKLLQDHQQGATAAAVACLFFFLMVREKL